DGLLAAERQAARNPGEARRTAEPPIPRQLADQVVDLRLGEPAEVLDGHELRWQRAAGRGQRERFTAGRERDGHVAPDDERVQARRERDLDRASPGER